VAHNVGACAAGLDLCVGIEQPCGDLGGACFQTTGKASFCGDQGGQCVVCARDADCVALGFGAGAACLVCDLPCPDTGTACTRAAA
jgi:hypothetical protein